MVATSDVNVDPEQGTGARLTTVCGLAMVLVGLIIGLRPLGDNSWLTHLATGQVMLDHGIVRHDPYSFTAGGDSWVVQSWLASLIYGGIDALSGGAGLRLFTGMMSALLAALLWRLSLPAGSVLGRVVVVLPALVVGVSLWSERPLLLGLVSLAAILVVTADTSRDIRWIAIISAFWANVHGSFPLGPVVLLAIAVGRRLDRADAGRETAAVRWSIIGSVAGGVVNPYGPALLLFPLRLLSRNEMLANVVEWRSPEFDGNATRAFLLIALIGIVGLVRTPRFHSAVPLVVVLAASLVAARNITVASVVCIPIAATGLAGLRSTSGGERSPRHTLAALAVVALMPIVALGAFSGDAIALDGYPVAAVDRMDELGWHREDVRWAHQDVVGNYLDFRYGRDARVFVDDRFELFDMALLDDYVTLVRAKRGWQDVLDRYDIDVVLWDHTHPLAELLELDPGWDEAFTVDGWSVYCRSSGCP